MVEVNTNFKFEDKNKSVKKSHFEIVYSTIIKVDDEIKEKKIEKIILCDLQKKIYPNLEKCLLNLLRDSGYQMSNLKKSWFWKFIQSKI